MDIKERIEALSILIAELEQRKADALDEIYETVEFAEPGELTPDFINWYYWDSGYPGKPLAKALKCTIAKLSAKIPGQPKAVLPCCKCGKGEIKIKFTNKGDRAEKIKQYNRDKRNNNLSWLEYMSHPYICDKCKQRFDEKQLSKHKRKQDSAALKRVEKYGHGLDLENMPYREYLQTEYWKMFAAKARKRAGYKCEKCGRSNRKLDVHHKTYERRGREWAGDVTVLCRTCHSLIHGREVTDIG